ncbi:glycosyltransferase family 2 protein [archaeon]|nr:glycosyltransferase family 2 protein [archaeon]
MSELTIVIPVYNEEASIEKTIKEVNKSLPKSAILAVNDGSKDNTENILKNLKNRYNNLTVITQQNKGYGGALATGFLNSKTEYIGFLDADLTYPPEYFSSMLELLKEKELDFVVGNRFGGKKNEMPLLRKIGNTIIRYFFLVWTGKYIDVTSGMRLFKREKLLTLNPETLPTGLDMITALSKRSVKRRLKYKQVKIHYPARGGASKLNAIKDFIKMVRNIIIE